MGCRVAAMKVAKAGCHCWAKRGRTERRTSKGWRVATILPKQDATAGLSGGEPSVGLPRDGESLQCCQSRMPLMLS